MSFYTRGMHLAISKPKKSQEVPYWYFSAIPFSQIYIEVSFWLSKIPPPHPKIIWSFSGLPDSQS